MSEHNPLTVARLNRYIAGVFESELVLQNLWVCGEVEECSRSGSNTYFTLTDGTARLSCVRFGINETERIVRGDEIAALGSVVYYQKGGRITFKVTKIQPFGKGRQLQLLKERKDKLAAEGLFENRPLPPPFIRHVAVVTSAGGAVIHDILSVFLRGHEYMEVTVYPVKVQGGNADTEIAAAVAAANTARSPADVLILARGGGSQADLSAFNSEIAARAAAGSGIPIISAVGHETDYTLCDFASGTRAGTPSLAAEYVAAVNMRMLSRFSTAYGRLSAAASAKLDNAVRRADAAAGRLSRAGTQLIYRGSRRLNGLSVRMRNALEKRMNVADGRVRTLATRASTLTERRLVPLETRMRAASSKLDVLSPLRRLAAGYAFATFQGKLIRSAGEVRSGDDIEVYVSDGRIRAAVTQVKQSNGGGSGE